MYEIPLYVCDLTPLWRVERDRVAVGTVALLVVHVDGEPVLGERVETRHHGVAPVAGEGHGVALVQGLVRIQQAPFPHPADLLEGRVMNGVRKREEWRGNGGGDAEENRLTAGFLSNEADTSKPNAFKTVKMWIFFFFYSSNYHEA